MRIDGLTQTRYNAMHAQQCYIPAQILTAYYTYVQRFRFEVRTVQVCPHQDHRARQNGPLTMAEQEGFEI